MFWSWLNSELCTCMCIISSVPYCTYLYWFLYIRQQVVSNSMMIKRLQVQCVLHKISWPWNDWDLYECIISSVPYCTYLYWLLYIRQQVVSNSMIVKRLQIQCVLHTKMINKEPSWLCTHRDLNHSKIRILYWWQCVCLMSLILIKHFWLLHIRLHVLSQLMMIWLWDYR